MNCSKCHQPGGAVNEATHCAPCHGECESETRRRAIVALARKQHEKEGALEIDDSAIVSDGQDNGAYVAAFVWVSFAGTQFDKEKEEAGTEKCDRCGETSVEIIGCPSGAEICPACFDGGEE